MLFLEDFGNEPILVCGKYSYIRLKIFIANIIGECNIIIQYIKQKIYRITTFS